MLPRPRGCPPGPRRQGQDRGELMIVLGWLVAIAAAIALIAIVVMFLNRFYRKSTRDVALVRTGFGGQRIIISGGCLALPFLHKVDEINMRTLRIEVRRTGDKS